MKVAIMGGSGYAGGELVRLLLRHPEVEIEKITSNRYPGEFVYMIHPNLRGNTSIKFSVFKIEEIIDTVETVFLATPHGVSKDIVPSFLEAGLKIIDLSADFRLKNPEMYPKWYGWTHPHPELLNSAVFGLPEIHREKIKGSPFIACWWWYSRYSVVIAALSGR